MEEEKKEFCVYGGNGWWWGVGQIVDTIKKNNTVSIKRQQGGETESCKNEESFVSKPLTIYEAATELMKNRNFGIKTVNDIMKKNWRDLWDNKKWEEYLKQKNLKK